MCQVPGAGCNSLWIKQMSCPVFQRAGPRGQFLQQLHGTRCNNCSPSPVPGIPTGDIQPGSSGLTGLPPTAMTRQRRVSREKTDHWGCGPSAFAYPVHAGEEAG